MDHEQNEVLTHDLTFITHYPTLRLYTKDDKVGLSYESHREVPDLIQFLKENSRVFFSATD